MFGESSKFSFPFAPSFDSVAMPGFDLDAMKEMQREFQKTAAAQSTKALALNRKLAALQQSQLSRATEAFGAQMQQGIQAGLDAWKLGVDAMLDAQKVVVDEQEAAVAGATATETPAS